METIATPDAVARLTELLGRTARGEAFEIVEDGRPVGLLVPPPPILGREPRRSVVERLKALRRGSGAKTVTDWRALAHMGHKH